MLDIKYVRDNLEEVEGLLRTRGLESPLAGLRQLDRQRRDLIAESEELKAKRNQVSAIIGKTKDKSQVQDEIAQMKEVSARIKQLDTELKEVEQGLQELLSTLPNLPHPDCPRGNSEEDNVEVRRWGQPPEVAFPIQAHWDLGEQLGILDFQRAGKIAGARFALYQGAGAALERALISFMLDIQTREHKYLEVLPPFMVNRESAFGTGQLPKFEEDLFHIEDPDYFLVPTAEVPVTNIHRQEILEPGSLPLRYTAYTPCFRREAGAAGRDTRGLIRQHQFNKVELVQFVAPEESDRALEALLQDAEVILQRLQLPYRVMDLCTGDIGFSAARTFDIEVWLPGQAAYREISSCSNFWDFQARRASIRFRREAKAKPEFVHTLNGSGLAVGRTLVAILENYQTRDGEVVIPEALRPYMGGMEKITAA